MAIIDSKNIVLLAGSAAACLAGIYVLWGPSERRKPRKKKVATCPGLVNLGNSCFLNAILQAIAPCGSAVQWLADFLESKESSTRYLASSIYKVLQVLNNDSVEFTEEFCPSDVITALQARRWVISPEEQDAHELFHVLTQTLDEEVTRYPAVLPLSEATKLEDDTYQIQPLSEARSRIGADLPVLPCREGRSPFTGTLACHLQCKRCGHKNPMRYDNFDSLSLTIPSNYGGQLSLHDMLAYYMRAETVDGVECEGCARRQGVSAPKPRSTFVKRLTIGKLPQCLCVHVQRTMWLSNGLPMKQHQHVRFPELLNMERYVYRKQQHKRPLPPSTLDLDSSAPGLLGGRARSNGYNKMGGGRKAPSTTPSPTVSTPYSAPVNLLKALNFHSRASMTGLSANTSSQVLGISHPEAISTHSAHIQRLAHTYTAEQLPLAVNTDSYKLTSAVAHLGDVFSGHFVTYRRAPSDNGQRFPERWLFTSDTLVKRASLAEVQATDAYMLFFDRI